MRVIMFPAVGLKNENRYIDILVKSLADIGVKVEPWHKHFSIQSGDVFHVHWPEIIPEIRNRKRNLLRGEWIAHQFFGTIRRVKKAGGRVVWTVHDLVPHWEHIHQSQYFQSFMQRFLSEVDVALSLTEVGIDQIKKQMPQLNHAVFAVAHHPHYQDVLGKPEFNEAARAEIGAIPEQKLFSFLGSLRANKRPEELAQAFRDIDPQEGFLLVAGAAPEQVAPIVRQLADGCSHIRLDLRRIPEDEIVRMYSATDIMVFPGNDYFNSGTIYTSLSLNVPVIAAWTPVNAELQRIVGENWLYLFKGKLSKEHLLVAAKVLANRRTNLQCNLKAFDPKVCAQEHVAAYLLPISKIGREV